MHTGTVFTESVKDGIIVLDDTGTLMDSEATALQEAERQTMLMDLMVLGNTLMEELELIGGDEC